MRSEVRRLEMHLAELDRARRAHLAQLRQMAERQLAEIAAAEQESAPRVPTAPLGMSNAARNAPVEQG